jgi:hypothetical protein
MSKNTAPERLALSMVTRLNGTASIFLHGRARLCWAVIFSLEKLDRINKMDTMISSKAPTVTQQ